MAQRDKKKAAMERAQLETSGLALQFFELDGSLKPGLEFGDPYRRDHTDTTSIAATQFDDGDPSEELFQEASSLVVGGHCHPNSLAAKVYHAHILGRQTSGAYPASFYWR